MTTYIETLFDLAESFVTYVKHCYEEEMDQGIKDDVADAIEQVFQYGMLVIDDADERYVVIDMLQNLVLLMKSASRGCVHVSKHEKYIYSILARKERKERKKERSYHPPHIPLSKYIYETDNTCTYIGRTPGAQP